MANGECDFTYSKDEWHFPCGTLCAEFKLHLLRWEDAQIVLSCVEDAERKVVGGWVDSAMREWVQSHQFTLSTACDDYLSENYDGGFGDRVDYEMSRAR